MTSLTNQISQERREALLIAAEELFSEFGFAGASIRMIAGRSGVNTAMIKYYFGSKEALYTAIFEFRLKQIREEVRHFESLALDPFQKLEAYLNAFILRIETNLGLHRLLSNQLAISHHPSVITLVSQAREQIYALIKSIVHTGIQKGCFKKVDVEMFALNVISLLPSVLTGRSASLLYPDCTNLHQPVNVTLANRMRHYLLSTLNFSYPQINEVPNG